MVVDTSNAKRSEYSYNEIECSFGKVMVGISKKDIIASYTDLIVGSNTFEMNLDHIVTNNSIIRNSFYGTGVKLNIEQYIMPYNTSYNLLGFDVGDYVYIDSLGIIHRFKRLTENEYRDVEGLGLKLKIDTINEITNESGEKYLFDSEGKLFLIKKRGVSEDIIKKIIFDNNGKIIKYYDIRKPERYISFEYDNNKLSKCILINNNKEKETVYYKYNNGFLTTIIHFVNRALESVRIIRYDEFENINGLYSTNDGYSVKLEYFNDKIVVKKGISKVTLNNFISVGEIIDDEYLYCENIDIGVYKNLDKSGMYVYQDEDPDYLIENEIKKEDSLLNVEVLNDFDLFEKYTYKYEEEKTLIFKDKGIDLCVFKNIDGKVLTIFETRGNDLLTNAPKDGIDIDGLVPDSYSSKTINRRMVRRCNSNTNINLNNSDFQMNKFNESLKDLYAKNYKLTFYIKILKDNLENINAIFLIKDVSYNKRIDIKAFNAYQYVEIPFSIDDSNYGNVELCFESNDDFEYDISNIRIEKCNKECIEIDGIEYNLRLLKKVKFDGDREISNDNCITINDLIKNIINKSKDTEFDFCYDNLRKYISKVKDIVLVFGALNIHSISQEKIIKFVTYDPYNLTKTKVRYEYSNNKIGVYKEVENLVSNEEEKVCNSTHCIYDLQGRIIKYVDTRGKATLNEYDACGNIISTVVANENDLDGNVLNAEAKRFYAYYTYDSNIDSLREKLTSLYNEEMGVLYKYDSDDRLKEVLDSSYNRQARYLYDNIGRLIKVVNDNSYNNIVYTNDGKLKELYDNVNYKYLFEEKNDEMNISINSNNIKQNLLNEKIHEKSLITTYPLTSFEERIDYDIDERVVMISGKNSTSSNQIIFTYQGKNDKINTNDRYVYSNSQSNIKNMYDTYSNQKTEFKYDSSNELNRVIIKESGTTLVDVEKTNNEVRYLVSGKEYKIKKEYDNNLIERRIIKQECIDNNQVINDYTYNYEYHDIVGKIKKKIGNNISIENRFDQTDNSKYYSPVIKSTAQTYYNKSFGAIYQYDKSLRIKEVGYYGIHTDNIKYTYDNTNRIIKERHTYTNSLSEAIVDEYLYEYNNYNSIDKVYKNGSLFKEFNYDNLGRLTSYKINGLNKNITYQGSNLNPYNYNSKVCDFDRNGLLTQLGFNRYYYNGQGLRTKKLTENNILHKYYYLGDRLLGEDINNLKIRYVYDLEGIIGARLYNNETVTNYVYVKDSYNNVVAVMKGNSVVSKYVYDAWGNILSEWKDSSDTFASINPIRYRSYYYDIETNLYYLQSRYYSPETGRFISSDDVNYLDSETLNGLNLYSYCYNDPINYVDPSGCFPVLACILCLTALAGMGLTIGGVASDNNTMTAIGLTMVAIPALISSGLAAFATTGTLATWIGAGTMVSGVGTGLFASAEYQEAFTGNNWIIDTTGMSESWYNGLMLGTSSLATLGTFASSFAYSFNINSIQKIGKVDDYFGIKFTQKAPSGNLRVKTLSIHPAHNGHPIHWQLNNINPVTGGIGKKIRWDLLLRRIIG